MVGLGELKGTAPHLQQLTITINGSTLHNPSGETVSWNKAEVDISGTPLAPRLTVAIDEA